ncbi:hypothetical protein D3C80_1471270 [compost metagenome]
MFRNLHLTAPLFGQQLAQVLDDCIPIPLLAVRCGLLKVFAGDMANLADLRRQRKYYQLEWLRIGEVELRHATLRFSGIRSPPPLGRGML